MTTATRCRNATRAGSSSTQQDNQAAADLHVLGFRLAEQLSTPVMVCMDGFILTHAFEEVDVPEQAQVDAYLPPYEPRQQLDPAAPVSIGALVGPEAFTEVRYLAHQTQLAGIGGDSAARGRVRRPSSAGRCPGLVNPYRVDGAETGRRRAGLGARNRRRSRRRATRRRVYAVGALGITTFRPFPAEAVRAAVAAGRRG